MRRITEIDDATLIAEAVEQERSLWACSPAQVVRAMGHMELRRLKAGEILYERGDDVTNTYLIISGSLATSNRDNETSNHVSGFLGEEALIDMTCYLGSAVATTDSLVLAVSKKAGEELARNPMFHDSLVASLNIRILQYAGPEEPKQNVSVGGVQPPSGSWRILIGWVLAATVPLCLILYFEGFGTQRDPRALYFFGVLSAVVILWMFDVVIDYIPSIMALLALVMFGVAPKEVVLGGYASPAFFMALSIFTLAAVIVMSGLGYRMLLWLLRIGPAHPAWHFLALFLSGVIFTPAIPTASGRLAIVGPFITDLLYGLSQEEKESVAPRLAAAILWGVGLFTTIFLSASPLNFLVYGILPKQEQVNFQWIDWFLAASVSGLVMLVLFLVVAGIFFHKGRRGITLSQTMLKEQTRLMGRIRPLEFGAIISLVILVLSFLTGALHQVEMPWIMMAIMLGLLMFGTIDRHDFRRRIDWGFLINLGAAIGIVETMLYLNIDEMIANQVGWLSTMMEQDFALFLFLLSGVVFLARLIMPADAVVLILCSIFMPTAAHLGVNPWIVGFVILLIGEGFIWPYQADYYSQLCVISDIDLAIDGPRILLLNFVVFLIKLAAIYASLPFWFYLGLI